jgi:serine/threonine protein kinase
MPEPALAPLAHPLGDEWVPYLDPPQTPNELGRLAQFRLFKLLGRGGMGSVFLAEDVDLGRRVALKALQPRRAGDVSARGRFVREARATAALHHDNVVPVFQVGDYRGLPYMTMPLLRGMTLEKWLAGGHRATITQILRLGRELGEGLAAAHKNHLVHRDVKPANVWLEAPHGRVRLFDFGLARGMRTAGAATPPGVVLGTPAYMALEVARGEVPDGRSDLYGFGCILYRLVTGRLPFGGVAAVEVLTSMFSDEPRPPSEFRPEVPPALEALILQMLRRDRHARPSSAREVVERLIAVEKVWHAEQRAAQFTSRLGPRLPMPGVDAGQTGSFPRPSGNANPPTLPERSRITRRIATFVAAGLLLGVGLGALLMPKRAPAEADPPPATAKKH